MSACPLVSACASVVGSGVLQVAVAPVWAAIVAVIRKFRQEPARPREPQGDRAPLHQVKDCPDYKIVVAAAVTV